MEYVGFDRDTYKSFKNIKDSRCLHMLNLVKLKEEAIYPDGSITSGFEAYMRYGKESEPIFKSFICISIKSNIFHNLHLPETNY